nr:Transcriptional regulator, GntR family domain / Aspartate aminotransferase (EC 2.6.1.1) [Kibdelosporangium sp. MJ126-NF4]
MYQQLYTQLRDLIVVRRQFAPGTRLPASRTLADELGISRNTVLLAYQRLRQDNCIDGAPGAGTVVLQPPPTRMPPPSPARCDALSDRARAAVANGPGHLIDRSACNRPFAVGMPPLDVFPSSLWGKLTANRLRNPPVKLLSGCETLGFTPLREAIAAYVGLMRGVRCRAEQIVVTRGAENALDLVIRSLLEPGDPIWLEEPGTIEARAAATWHGQRVCPVRVDDEGLVVSEGPDARMAVVTPARQLPLGTAMSARRREELLGWAERTGSWIVELDTEAPFLSPHATPPLQTQDANGQVIYVGTFRNLLFPEVRAGYCVLPEALVDPISAVLWQSGSGVSALIQHVLADFINYQYFPRYLRRVRDVCASRRATLLTALRQHGADWLTVREDAAGGSFLACLTDHPIDEKTLTDRASPASLSLHSIDRYYAGQRQLSGVVLGYAAVGEAAIAPAVQRLMDVLR